MARTRRGPHFETGGWVTAGKEEYVSTIPIMAPGRDALLQDEKVNNVRVHVRSITRQFARHFSYECRQSSDCWRSEGMSSPIPINRRLNGKLQTPSNNTALKDDGD